MTDERPASEDTLALVQALLSRRDIIEQAESAFRRAYPDAPDHMIETATFHVFRDGIGAALDWVAAAERFLRQPTAELDYGATWHLIYHLYNWQQFQALMPIGRVGLLERLEDIRLFIAEANPEAAVKVLEQLAEMFRGDVVPPNIG
jgi:hypothetical protein